MALSCWLFWHRYGPWFRSVAEPINRTQTTSGWLSQYVVQSRLCSRCGHIQTREQT